MHNREITQIEKTDSLYQNSIVKAKQYVFAASLRETYVNTKNTTEFKKTQKLDLRLLKIQIL